MILGLLSIDIYFIRFITNLSLDNIKFEDIVSRLIVEPPAIWQEGLIH